MKKAVILFIIFLIILGAGITEHFFVVKPGYLIGNLTKIGVADVPDIGYFNIRDDQ